jgi:hypothetical protein
MAICNVSSTLIGLEENMPPERYVSELMKLWDKQKILEEKFEEEKDSHLKAQVAKEDHSVPIKSEPAKKRLKQKLFLPSKEICSTERRCHSQASLAAPAVAAAAFAPRTISLRIVKKYDCGRIKFGATTIDPNRVLQLEPEFVALITLLFQQFIDLA